MKALKNPIDLKGVEEESEMQKYDFLRENRLLCLLLLFKKVKLDLEDIWNYVTLKMWRARQSIK
jgi:hypothetical protein